ncbi:MAG: ERF family protein [Oscillospiraceae bacterium]|nr:ERF family protein [Oscillospiraceae bacterium]
MANVYEKLLAVQSELKAPKSQYNSFGKYNYRSAEDIVEAAKPLCKANGILLTLSDSVELVGAKAYIKATASVVDVADPNGKVEVSAYAREPLDKKGMDDSQITGAASSYARKYALNGLFAIDDTKDADSEAPPKPPKAPQKQPPAQLDKVMCPQCGKQIVSQADKNGKMRTPQEVLQMCGGVCVECMKKNNPKT